MRASLLRIFVMTTIAAVAGIGYGRGVAKLAWFADPQELVEKKRIVEEAGIELAAFKALYESGAALVVDARATPDFVRSHLDAPLITNIPGDDHLNLAMHLDRIASYRTMPIVLYCNSATCDMAEALYKAMKAEGFGDLHIFVPGFVGIEEAKLPIAVGPDVMAGGAAGQEGG